MTTYRTPWPETVDMHIAVPFENQGRFLSWFERVYLKATTDVEEFASDEGNIRRGMVCYMQMIANAVRMCLLRKLVS
jgi:hypothetical protein